MIKKTLKIVGIILLLLVAALFAIPFLFKDTIREKVSEAINKKVDATVSFGDVGLSLFRNFPQAAVTVDKLLIINKAPFAGDTLVSMGEINLKMSVRELFKGKEEPMDIDAFTSTNARINILFNKDGIGNFDIALKDDSTKDDSKSDPLSLKVKQYKFENLHLRYFDERSKIKMVVDSLYHTGSGDFAASKLDLSTTSRAKISVDVDKVNYMNRVALTLDAVLGIDLTKNIYTFRNNKALVNKLPLEFGGSIQIVDAGQLYDITFRTPTSGFKNFLGLVPSKYSGSIENVQTSGDFSISGFAKGLYSEKSVPKFNLAIASNNASFKYPNLPKSVDGIVIDTRIINETGILNDTYVDLAKLSFRIDRDVFNAKATIRNIVENPLIDAKLNGTINLSNLSKAYPVKLKTPLSGMLTADVAAKFDMKSVEAGQYQNMQNSGTATLTDFTYAGDDQKPVRINKADVGFTPSRIDLRKLDAATGKTDLRVNGVIENFYGFLLKDQELKGTFNLASNQFAVSDFMTAPRTESRQPAVKDAVKIPAFLNCTLNARANTVLYDNLVMKDVSGTVIVRDETATIKNLKTSIFGGTIAANGDVSTKAAKPVFDMNLGLNAVDIQQTFTQLEMMKRIAPIAGVINGKLNSTINVRGNLDAKEMTPDLKTLTGNLAGQLLSTTVNEKSSPLLNKLDESLSFIDLKAALTFTNGQVSLKPITLKYQDIKVDVNGQHGFDQSMNYALKFNVPAKYLGSYANGLISKLSPSEAGKLENIPINAIVTGNFKNPKISTDVKQAVGNLTSQIVAQQKDRLVKQGTSALGNILSGNKKDTTHTKKNDDVKKQAGELLNGLFGKKKTP